MVCGGVRMRTGAGQGDGASQACWEYCAHKGQYPDVQSQVHRAHSQPRIEPSREFRRPLQSMERQDKLRLHGQSHLKHTIWLLERLSPEDHLLDRIEDRPAKGLIDR